MTVSVTKEHENPPSPPFRKGGIDWGTFPLRKGGWRGIDEDSFLNNNINNNLDVHFQRK